MTDIMPIIRVRRKRSADPHAALIMETKKRKVKLKAKALNSLVSTVMVQVAQLTAIVTSRKMKAVRYDYYKIYRGSMTEPIKQWDSDIELRFATEEEQTLLLGNSDSE
ncbi:hypothetical protein OSTOST_20293, partial [Ostertagia ostertagi]